MQIQEFIDRWRNTQAAERANKDSYLKELCRVLGVPEPDGKTNDPERDHYVFEADAVVYDEDGRRHVGKMDLYRRGHFVLEAKQSAARGAKGGTAKWGTPGWNLAMTEAAGQAFGYARTLDDPPPFVIVADIGQSFDLYACFDGTGAYRAFPNAQKHRLWLKDLEKHADVLRKIWVDPNSLDPRRHSERVSQEVAADLAELATELETAGHDAELVSKFLMRCIFCFFAEDVGLLQDDVFTQFIEKQWLPDPASFKDGVEELWGAMNAGKKFYVLGKLLKFNGGLFVDPVALDLTAKQLHVLAKAGRHDWSEVEPAIFGTLVEQALNPKERHRLGAHFTPTDYVRRLVRPTVEEPLRTEWEMVRVQVRQLVVPGEPAKASSLAKARALVEVFRERLCRIRVLDPACGTANFLYAAFHMFKQLESEVLATLDDLGVSQMNLGENLTVTPEQFRGLEVRVGSKEIAELVLWIGYLQWHHKMFGGTKKPPEPILRDYKNIECRDAVLAFDARDVARDKAGVAIAVWDGETMKRHAATGSLVPDERFTTPVLACINPRVAEWPEADFIVGNPPFIGNKRMRAALGDGYVGALRELHPDVPETADYVMYWWNHAASLVEQGKVTRFGFITTNSITQTFNRQVVQKYLDKGMSLIFGIPDHPWTDSADGAAVRVAMTAVQNGTHTGRLLAVTDESDEGLQFSEAVGSIQPDLRIGARVAAAGPLQANRNLSFQGVIPLGDGFRVSPEELEGMLSKHEGERPAAKRFVIGRDLVQRAQARWVIDFFGLSEEQARKRYPRLFQHALDRVKPERDQNRRDTRRKNWWLFGENAPKMRRALAGLNRYIATVETSKFKPFIFIDGDVLPDHKVYAIASDSAYVLGVLSSRVHAAWALAAGGRLGVGNDPTWTNTTCFLPFPFPGAQESQKLQIAEFGEALDSHRKTQQALYPALTLTGMYNVLASLRSGRELSAKERTIHEQGLVSVLKDLHDKLDAAVLDAYGWSHAVSDEQILAHLVALNSERVAEEQVGLIHWLRPEFQKDTAALAGSGQAETAAATKQLSLPWPKDDLPRQVTAVRDLLATIQTSMTANDVANAYDGADSKSVLPALQTLEALGMAAGFESDRGKCWQGLARASGERTYGSGRRPTSRPAAAARG